MLRAFALILGFVLIAAALIGTMAGGRAIGPGVIGPGVIGVVLVLSLVFERYIYKPIRPEPPGPGWDKTGERFADPRSGRNVAVYFNPRTGERRYVAESDG
jgi:hypothetical protein